MDVFTKLKLRGINPHDTKLFKYDSEEVLTCPHFCSNATIACGDASCPFANDNPSLAFATKESGSTAKPFISVEFLHFHFFINSFDISTLCGAPRELFVEGSNNGNEWHEISHITTPLNDNCMHSFKCQNPGSYRIIRFRQIGIDQAGSYRFHVHYIKLFGIIKAKYDCTNMINTQRSHLTIYYTLSFLIS